VWMGDKGARDEWKTNSRETRVKTRMPRRFVTVEAFGIYRNSPRRYAFGWSLE
jgi:hypothetical protein